MPALLSLTMAAGALAQTKLPDPSRTVFKCVVAGRTAYTDQPCLGAQRVDVEPTRGLNKSTGKELLGADVARERNREAFAEVIRPLTGLDAKQLDTQGKRMQLRPELRSECARLDTEIQTSELRERSAAPQERTQIQRSLLTQRQQHNRLEC